MQNIAYGWLLGRENSDLDVTMWRWEDDRTTISHTHRAELSPLDV